MAVANGVAVNKDQGGLEIRHLSYLHKRALGEIFAVNEGWKEFMARIRMPGKPSQNRFSSDDIRILDTAVKNGQASSGFELLIDEWGTMGKRRPTLNDVLNLCMEMEAYAAASYISAQVLKRGEICPPSVIMDTAEGLTEIPAAAALDNLTVNETGDGVDLVTLNRAAAAAAADLQCPTVEDEQFDALLEADLESLMNNSNNANTVADDNFAAAAATTNSSLSMLQTEENSDFLVDPRPAENTMLAHRVKYSYLCKITDNFAPERFVGRGGFASVYEGITLRSKARIAVKKLKSSGGGGAAAAAGGPGHFDQEAMLQQLNYEVDQLPRLKHPNIIELLGYSNDSGAEGACCLLFPLMTGGTLEKRLRSNTTDFFPLDSKQRMAIALGIARGLNFLHTRPKCLIHRDIKSSNILLDQNHLPKIADFGLLRYAVSGDGESVTFTAAVKGTAAYMPPEAINCDVSAKWDTWSYGVVVLELLTGLPVMDRSREDHDLTSHVKNLAEEEDFEVSQIFDSNSDWSLSEGTLMYQISDKCLKRNKRTRPNMADIITMIQK